MAVAAFEGELREEVLPSCRPAVLPSCRPAVLPSCRPAVLPSCRPAVISPAVLPSCRHQSSGRGHQEEVKNKITRFPFFWFFYLLPILNYQFPVTDSQLPIRKHIFQRRASSGKNASNQCSHRSGQRVQAAKLPQGASS